MNKRFIGVPAKLLMLVVGALMLLSAGFSVVSLSRLNQEFKQYHSDTLQQGQAQFQLHSGIIIEQLSLWLESFGDLVRVKEHNDFDLLTEALSQQYDALQLHHNVENIWLLDAEQNILYSSSTLPNYVMKSVNNVLDLQMPENILYCESSCEQLITVPILNKKGDMAVIAISVSLVDMIYAINQSLKSDVAVVSYAVNEDNQLSQAQFISSSNKELIKKLFVNANDQRDIALVKESGLQTDLGDKSYLINLMDLSFNQKRAYYIALIDEVTIFKEKNRTYRRQFLFSAGFIFIALAVLVYLVASPFTNRLLALSNVLPYLAQKEFEKFRSIKIKRQSFFSDELDILADATTELSYELEQLNIEVEQKTKELENIAMYDILTGLPNRNMLNYQLRKVFANMGRYNSSVAVLFLDLDDFKKVNDSNGHSEGDRLLIEAANRVRLSIRNIDVACRFGGDEFVVILGHVKSIEDAKVVADNILQRFKAPIKVGSSIFYVSTSIGIAYTDDDTTKPEDMVSYADIAMYEAKDHGGAQYHIYHQDMYQRVAHRVMLEAEVRQALKRNEFSLSLQPQLGAKNKRLYGMEALLRWNHHERGLISPDDFIPILENSEYMIELGYWVIRRCFEIMTDMHKQGLKSTRIAINLSAGQFVDPNLPNYLARLLTEFSLSADNFELELTEQTLVKDIDRAIDMMNSLKDIGFSFAIDDFGTGYSSLAYLKKMPVDVIKIDKSFIFGMLENHADYQIIMSTIAMVKNLGLQVVAEGVETSAQLRSLSENDCDIIQGYYFSKPIPEAELLGFLKEKVVEGYWKTQAQSAS